MPHTCLPCHRTPVAVPPRGTSHCYCCRKVRPAANAAAARCIGPLQGVSCHHHKNHFCHCHEVHRATAKCIPSLPPPLCCMSWDVPRNGGNNGRVHLTVATPKHTSWQGQQRWEKPPSAGGKGWTHLVAVVAIATGHASWWWQQWWQYTPRSGSNSGDRMCLAVVAMWAGYASQQQLQHNGFCSGDNSRSPVAL